MENQIKFTEEELNNIKTIRDQSTELVLDFGQVELDLFVVNKRLTDLQAEKEKLQSTYIDLQTREQSLIQELNTKYGSGTVDIESGVFIPNK